MKKSNQLITLIIKEKEQGSEHGDSLNVLYCILSSSSVYSPR